MRDITAVYPEIIVTVVAMVLLIADAVLDRRRAAAALPIVTITGLVVALAAVFNDVPAGQYFAMGDNRDDSLDSRTQLQIRDASGAIRTRDELGWYVPAENLVGRAEFIFFSHDPSAAGWLEPWKWPQAIRWNRFFMAIH